MIQRYDNAPELVIRIGFGAEFFRWFQDIQNFGFYVVPLIQIKIVPANSVELTRLPEIGIIVNPQ